MENGEPRSEVKEIIPDRVFREVASPGEGISLIRDFWAAMPHGKDLTLPRTEDPGSWKELTMGDRTALIYRSGRWQVGIMPNTGNSLSQEAQDWLKEKGWLET